MSQFFNLTSHGILIPKSAILAIKPMISFSKHHALEDSELLPNIYVKTTTAIEILFYITVTDNFASILERSAPIKEDDETLESTLENISVQGLRKLIKDLGGKAKRSHTKEHIISSIMEYEEEDVLETIEEKDYATVNSPATPSNTGWVSVDLNIDGIEEVSRPLLDAEPLSSNQSSAMYQKLQVFVEGYKQEYEEYVSQDSRIDDRLDPDTDFSPIDTEAAKKAADEKRDQLRARLSKRINSIRDRLPTIMGGNEKVLISAYDRHQFLELTGMSEDVHNDLEKKMGDLSGLIGTVNL